MPIFNFAQPQYLADGVYAKINQSGQLVLTTSHHDDAQADNVIYLEPETLTALLTYIHRYNPQFTNAIK